MGQSIQRPERGSIVTVGALAQPRPGRARGRSLPPVLAMLILMLVLPFLTSGCLGMGDKRSVKAFCDTFKTQAIALHTKYAQADQSIKGGGVGYLTGLLTLVQSTGDMVVMFDALDKVAPDDIEPDVAQVLDSMKQAETNNNNALSNPLGALGSGILIALQSGGAYNAVNSYIGQHCDLSFEQ